MNRRHFLNLLFGAAAAGSSSSPSPPPPPPPAPPAVAGAKAELSVGLNYWLDYTREPGPANLAAYSNNYEVIGGGDPVGQDLEGPTSDCYLGIYPGPVLTAPVLLTGEFEGSCTGLQWRGGLSTHNAGRDLSWSYNSGENKVHFQYTLDPTLPDYSEHAPQIQITGSRRNPGDAPGTGFRNAFIWKPEEVGNRTRYWSLDFFRLIEGFDVVRTMYMQDVWFNTLHWTAAMEERTGRKVHHWENLVKIANEGDKAGLWICTHFWQDDDSIANFIRYFDDQLDAGRFFYLEYANEVWNSGTPISHMNTAWTLEELHGGFTDPYALGLRQIQSISGDGSHITVTMNANMTMPSVNEHVQIENFYNGGLKTCTSSTANSWSFAGSLVGSMRMDSTYNVRTTSSPAYNQNVGVFAVVGDGSITQVIVPQGSPMPAAGDSVQLTGFGGNALVTVTYSNGTTAWNFLSTFNGSIRNDSRFWSREPGLSTLYPEDQAGDNIFGIASRRVVRRVKEIGAIARATLGDAKMDAGRCRVIYAGAFQNENYGNKLAYLSRIVGGDANVKNYIYGFGNASYCDLSRNEMGDNTGFDVDKTDFPITVQQCLDEFDYNLDHGWQDALNFGDNYILAFQYGIKRCSYEGSYFTTTHPNAGAGNVPKNQAVKLQSRLADGQYALTTKMLETLSLYGLNHYDHHSIQFPPNAAALYSSCYTTDPAVHTGMWQAYIDWAARDAATVPGMNPVALNVGGTFSLDGRKTVQKGPRPVSGPFLPLSQLQGNAQDHVANYVVTFRDAGVYALVITYACNNNRDIRIQHNFGTEFTRTLSVTAGSVYPNLNGSADTTAASYTCSAGPNIFRLIQVENHGADENIQAVKFIRLS